LKYYLIHESIRVNEKIEGGLEMDRRKVKKLLKLKKEVIKAEISCLECEKKKKEKEKKYFEYVLEIMKENRENINEVEQLIKLAEELIEQLNRVIHIQKIELQKIDIKIQRLR